MQLVAQPWSRITALAERSEPAQLRIKDYLAGYVGYMGARVSLLTADGWRAVSERLEVLDRYWVADAMVGDLVRTLIRWNRPYWRWWIEERYGVLDEDGKLIALKPAQARQYITLRREFLRRLQAGEGGHHA